MHYNDLTWRHFLNPTNAGVLCGAAVRRGAAGSRAFGTWVQFDVQVGTVGDPIEAVRFLAFGCPHVIAASDWIATNAVGGPAEPVLPLAVARLLDLVGAPVEKLGRLLIVEDAWIAALLPPS